MDQSKANRMGRPPFNPSPADRDKVSRMSAMGIPQEQIGLIFKMSPKTLRKHFREELTTAAVEANFQVAQTLFQLATSGKHLSATIFWAKTRNRFTTSTPAKAKKSPEPKPPSPPSTFVVLNNEGSPLIEE
jgi:hypothetical protein